MVRRQEAIDTISKAPSVQEYLSSGNLTFALVSDNTKPGAYLDSAKDCSYIIHLASPLSTQPGDLVAQAIAGNKAALEAAEATPTVKRVVFTASTAAIRPYERLFAQHPANQAVASGISDEVTTLTAETRVHNQPPVSDDAPGAHRYTNSKIAAHNLVREYAEADDHAGFSIVNILPGFVLGPEELPSSKSEAFHGSNIILSWLFTDLDLSLILGGTKSDALLLSETVHLNDVVEGHVKALDTEKVPGRYRNFLLCSDSPSGPVIMDAADIVRRTLPQEAAEGKIPFKDYLGKQAALCFRLLPLFLYAFHASWLIISSSRAYCMKKRERERK